MELRDCFDLLGFKVKDKVTGMEGVCTSISIDLYGCIQALVNPGLDKDGKHRDQVYYDVNRLDKTSKKAVMPLPPILQPVGYVASPKDKGPAEKPGALKP